MSISTFQITNLWELLVAIATRSLNKMEQKNINICSSHKCYIKHEKNQPHSFREIVLKC